MQWKVFLIKILHQNAIKLRKIAKNDQKSHITKK